MTMHRVEEGQRLSEIAANYGISTDEIVRANPTKQAVMLASGAQVFASLAAGEDIELPGVLAADPVILGAWVNGGAGQVPNPPRVFLEAALQEVTEANWGNTTFATRRVSLDGARRRVASALLYEESRKGSPERIARIKEILADVEWLQGLAIAEKNEPNPENPPSIDNWYPRTNRLKKRLSTEIGNYFATIESTKPAPTTQRQIYLPATGAFPPASGPTWGGPLKVQVPFEIVQMPFEATVDDSQKRQDACEAKNLRLNRETGQCVNIADGTSTDPFTGAVTGTLTKLKVEEECVASGRVYDFVKKSCTCPDGTWWKQETNSCVPNDSQASLPPSREEACEQSKGLFDRSTGACTCPNGSELDLKTGKCGGIFYQQAGPVREKMGDGDAKILAEAAEQARKKELEKRAADAAASSTKTKKVLIVAGSVLALGLAGLGAWHVFAKDKTAP